MQIIKYVDLFIGALINMILYAYVVKKVFNLEFIKSKKIIILNLILSALALALINTFNKDTFKLLFTYPFICIAIKYIFFTKLDYSMTYVIFATLYMFVGEIILGITCSILPFDYTFIFNNMLGTSVGAIIIALFTILLIKFNKLNKKVYGLAEGINKKSNVLTIIFIILIIGALTYKISNSDATIINIIMNITISITFIFLIYMYYKENAKLQDLSENYNEMFKYLENYEKELIEKRKIIHDYKNQLIVIDGYIGDNKKLKEYIKEIIKEQKQINDNPLIKNIDKLPKGLKGLIYYKFSHMNEEICVILDIYNNLKSFEKINSKLNKDVLKIIGILIDNALEAVEVENEKNINIEFYLKKGVFKMILINSCTSNIKSTNLMNLGFSTKGSNRGYGLSLVKDILNKQKNINLNLKKENNNFISELIVKLK